MNKKRLNELLKIPFPLIQGGMSNIADATFASLVCEAGGLGQIACGDKTASMVRDEIRLLKSLTNRPFGVNIMLLNPECGEIARVIVEEEVKVVTTGGGNPSVYIPLWKDHHIKVIPVVASVAMAKRVERAGADMVIVEGTEAGGHVGETTTMCLLPQVVDGVSIPVIAAGGIGDFRGVQVCLSLGAVGVQVGTILLATKECKIHALYKEALINAKDTDTIVIGKAFGSPVRVLKTPKALELNKLTDLSRMAFEQLLIDGSLIAVNQGDYQEGLFMAGQVCGLIKDIKTVKETIEDLFKNEHA